MELNQKKQINNKANEIIKLFIDNEIPLSQQLEILKRVKDKIDFCRITNEKINEKTLFD